MIRADELIVDNFAGGGGASLGIETALGRSVDIAINHDPEAVAMHAANHPGTTHFTQNIWQIDPRDVCRGRPVGLAWFSPDCKHHSKAKGGKPVERHIRDLAWVVVHWAKLVRPRIIMIENVEEFRDWGPLIEAADGKLRPCPLRKGLTFRRWTRELRRLGYKVEVRELRACNYGAPTIRKRLFVIARRDGLPIVWPAPTHAKDGAGGLLPWRTAAQIIDWSLPCPSIFLTREEGRAVGVNRPLAEATMRRIARGVRRYVLEAAQPFIVPVTHAGDDRVQPIDEPLRTVTTAHRGEHAVVAPVIVGLAHGTHPERPGTRSHGPDEPMRTIHAVSGNHALVAPYLVPRYGERPGQEPRTYPADAPAPTIVPTANQGSLAAVHLTKFAEHGAGEQPDEPLHTVMAGAPRHGLVAAFLAQHNTDVVGHDATEPVSTIVGKGCTQGLVAATLSHAYSSNTCGGQGDPRQPLKTILTGGHAGLVAAFLQKYYGTGGQDQDCRGPLHTVPTKARFGLVTVAGELWRIADIGMRMLSPRELFRAQGFPDSYVIDPVVDGKRLTKTAQIRSCGNSVCPPLAAAIVTANVAVQAAEARPA